MWIKYYVYHERDAYKVIRLRYRSQLKKPPSAKKNAYLEFFYSISWTAVLFFEYLCAAKLAIVNAFWLVLYIIKVVWRIATGRAMKPKVDARGRFVVDIVWVLAKSTVFDWWAGQFQLKERSLIFRFGVLLWKNSKTVFKKSGKCDLDFFLWRERSKLKRAI
jgi:hypothetical protein